MATRASQIDFASAQSHQTLVATTAISSSDHVGLSLRDSNRAHSLGVSTKRKVKDPFRKTEYKRTWGMNAGLLDSLPPISTTHLPDNPIPPLNMQIKSSS